MRRIGLALVGSCLLHLLALWSYQRWLAEPIAETLHPARFHLAQQRPPTERFRSAAPDAPSPTQLERLIAGQPPPDPAAIPLVAPLRQKPDSLLSLVTPPRPGAKSGAFKARRDTFLSLNELQLQTERQRAEEKAQYARRWMPDADTTDADSRNRRRAAEIVDRAIAAMGGLDRLLRVRDKQVGVESYDASDRKWRPTEEQFYYRGRKYLEKQADGQVRGYDGERAWAYRYGVRRPAPARQLRQRAERWDFLSRFKGDGVLLHYLGRTTLPGNEAVHAVEVDDRKYGRLWQAYFSPLSHLLVAYRQGRMLVRVQDYRTTAGIKSPYETWSHFGRFIARHRHATLFNTGIGPAAFADPGGRRWDAAAMTALLGGPADAKTRLALNSIDQIFTLWDEEGPVDVPIDEASNQLLDAYLGRKLKAAGVLGDRQSPYRVDITIEGYYREESRDYPAYSIHFHLVITDPGAPAPLLDRVVSHRWRSALYPPIDQFVADRLTMLLVESIGRALPRGG